MKKSVSFGLATLIGAAAMASLPPVENQQTQSQQDKASVEVILNVTPEQRDELAKVLNQLNIEVKDWRVIEVRELPSRCC